MASKTSRQQQVQITSAETHKEIISDSCFFACQTRLKMLSTLALEDPDWLRKNDDMFSGFVNILVDLNDLLELAVDKSNREYSELLEKLRSAGQQP